MDQPVTLTADDVARIREYQRRADELLADDAVRPVEAAGPLWQLSGYLENALNRAQTAGHSA